MRFRQMATYRGVPYEVGVGPSESDVALFAACPPPEELGFEPAAGYWRKRVIRAEVDVLWESRPIGTFHGEACLVLDDLGDRLHIVYLGKDARRAGELGYWQVDRGVFELLTPRDEVTSLTEEKVEKNLSRARPEPAAAPQPSYPYGAQPWSAAPTAAPVPADTRGRGYPAEPALAPAGAWNGTGAPGGAPQWNGNGTGGHTAPSGHAAAGGPDGWTGHGTGPQPAVAGPPGGEHWNGAPGPGSGGYGAPGNWNGHGAPVDTGGWNGNGIQPPPAGWNGNGPAGMNGHGPVNGHGTGPWNGMGTATQAPPSGPDSILDGTPLARPSRRGQPSSGRRSARKQRVQTRSIFSELADLAAIPRSAYALEQESDGAMCLLRTNEGFEVFSAADGARHEVRTFEDEEAAYFYLFGVLAAEAVRNGGLTPPRP
jgi:hypothetical protein